MQLFYVPDITGDEITLDEDESKHAVRVLRLTEGDSVQLIDGKGGFYDAEIKMAHPKKCGIRILNYSKEFGKRNFGLHIAIAPTKNNDRFEWFLEKATEIGIDEVTPLITEHSERKKINYERMQKIVVSAAKQSVKAYIPKLNKPVNFSEVINYSDSTQKYIAHCFNRNKKHLKELALKGSNTLILIGPEGDFSLNEVEFAEKYGFKGITLGNSRLRTETAGIVACHIVNLMNE